MDIEKVIKAAIQQEIEKEITTAVEEAKKEIEQRIRKKLGQITLAIFQQYDVYSNHNEICIKVRNEVK